SSLMSVCRGTTNRTGPHRYRECEPPSRRSMKPTPFVLACLATLRSNAAQRMSVVQAASQRLASVVDTRSVAWADHARQARWRYRQSHLIGSGRMCPRQDPSVLDDPKAPGAREPSGSPTTPEPPMEVPVPEVETELVATLVASRNGGWATLLSTGAPT